MTKFQKGGVRILALFTVLAVLLMTLSFVSSTKATALTAAKDTISDSDLSAVATHVFTFTTGVELTNGDMIDITFPAGFTDIAVGNVACPSDASAGFADPVVTCTVGTALTGAQTVEVTGVTNPSSAGSQTINILTENASSVEIESVDVMVAIIDDVAVTATVSSTLTFTVAAVDPGVNINTGGVTTITSTATTIPFSILTAGTEAIGGHTLTVETNADDGFTVTVQQDDDLTSAGASDIDCFKDGTAQTTPTAWTSPLGTLGTESTYGHFGFTSEDSNLNGDEFGDALYAGLDGTTADEVFSNDGPADGLTADSGSTKVGYKVEIDELQEAGDYTNTLTYICTPTY